MDRLRSEQFAELGRQQRQRRPRRKGRLFGYLLLAVNLGFLLLSLTTLVQGFTESPGMATFGVVLIIGFWAVVDVILGVVYLVLRDRR